MRFMGNELYLLPSVSERTSSGAGVPQAVLVEAVEGAETTGVGAGKPEGEVRRSPCAVASSNQESKYPRWWCRPRVVLGECECDRWCWCECHGSLLWRGSMTKLGECSSSGSRGDPHPCRRGSPPSILARSAVAADDDGNGIPAEAGTVTLGRSWGAFHVTFGSPTALKSESGCSFSRSSSMCMFRARNLAVRLSHALVPCSSSSSCTALSNLRRKSASWSTFADLTGQLGG